MARYTIYEILETASQFQKKEDKIAYLQQNDTAQLRTVLNFTFNPRIKWLLPEGDTKEPIYKPCPDENMETRFYVEARRLYLFVEGGNPNLTDVRRERLFVEILESIHPDDAKLLWEMKDKKLPFKGLTAKIVEEAFPNIFNG